jgi:hypothetical protein
MLSLFISSNVIPDEYCRMVVLLCRSTSHLTGPILSHPVIIQSHCHRNTSFIHTFLHTLYTHSYIHNTFITTCIQAFIHTYIHTYNTPTKSFIHDYIDHLVACFSCITKKSHPQRVWSRDVSIERTSQKSHPQCVWSRDVIIKRIPSNIFCQQPICKLTFSFPKKKKGDLKCV